MTVAAPSRFRLLPVDPSIGWVPYVWLLYLSSLVIEPVNRDASMVEWTVTGAVVVVFVVTYFRSYWVQGRALLSIIAVQVLLGIGLSAVNSAARLDRGDLAIRTILLIWLVAIGTSWGFDQELYHWMASAVLVPLIGAVCWHFESFRRADAKLRLAQNEVVRFAAVAERERIARDLHDVLGHTLTLIVLKSELASRLAERDPARAVQEIRELEQVSRRALSDVRDAIAGYRASWDDEVVRARAILRTAGVRAEFIGRPDALDRGAEETLALAVREAITNVVRHARATEISVTWTRDGDRGRLEVVDDGRGSDAGDRDARTGAGGAEGNGLLGLRERVEALGGAVQFGSRTPVRGSRLAIEIPLAGASA
jgi:two-component system sensor histidine kinase DesK